MKHALKSPLCPTRHSRPLLVWRVGIGALLLWSAFALPVQALELCGEQSKTMMRSVGINEAQIAALCAKAERAQALMALSVHRTADELGYCRVTLLLQNNSRQYVNVLTLTVAEGRFDVFRFDNLLPGGRAYASANSRILLACDELEEVGLVFHWPPSIRVADRALNGEVLRQYRPVLMSPALHWNR